MGKRRNNHPKRKNKIKICDTHKKRWII